MTDELKIEKLKEMLGFADDLAGVDDPILVSAVPRLVAILDDALLTLDVS